MICNEVRKLQSWEINTYFCFTPANILDDIYHWVFVMKELKKSEKLKYRNTCVLAFDMVERNVAFRVLNSH